MSYSWLEIFIDGDEFLLSIFSKNMSQLYKALWCNDPYLSVIIYNSYLGHYEASDSIISIMKNNEVESKEVLKNMLNLHKSFYKGISLDMVEKLF